MNIMKKLMSLLLAVLMLCGTLTCFTLTISAADESAETDLAGTEDGETVDYLNQIFKTPEDKLATMKFTVTKGNYKIYADEKSGEVAVQDLTTGQAIFTNPYDLGASSAVDTVKKQLLSQIMVRYSENGRPKDYYSYEYAAERDQIKVKNIKNGVRVEYTIGREEARHLVPRYIEESRYMEQIRKPVLEYYNGDEDNFYFEQFEVYFTRKSLEDCPNAKLQADMIAAYPIVEKMNIWVFDPSAKPAQIEMIEEVIKSACPNYTYEEMDYDHQLTGYTSEEDNPPVFKMALEYTIEEDGFSVRLPANGIRFNESKFQLESVTVLPYMGAGNITYDGYAFFPDGSGALFAFDDMRDVLSNTVTSKVYGTDYAYHQISGTYQQTVRYPVFGVVEKTRFYDFAQFDAKEQQVVTTRLNGMIYDAVNAYRTEGATLKEDLRPYENYFVESEITEQVISRGYVAVIEEGDAMAEISVTHEGNLHPYDAVQMKFYPRPQDTYNMAEAISVGTATDWTVVSSRKYVGNYKIRYIMLTDANLAAEKQMKNGEWYEATWMGMATAYRDYLIEREILAPLSEQETSGDIPLYIEAFGSVETVEKYLSIPFNVKKPLTSFEDAQTMYTELLSKGVSNINFKLTGHANGGMYSKAAYNLKWEKSVSKEVSFQELIDFATKINQGNYEDLIAFAKENEIFETEEELAAFEEYVASLESSNLGIYPDFDFSYVWSFEDTLFDGLTLRKHTSRTIDDRAAQKRIYVATRQKHMSYYQLAVSPAYFSRFYEKLVSKYLDYDNVTGISVGSFGNALNSDFDEDEPYNREDAKTFVKTALDYLSNTSELDVMVDGGNAYTWQYVDHILGAAVDSSRYIRASYSVPFLGVVLHGYTNFTGTPLNMEGDLNYAKLKALENGAAVYFTLSYQNTQTLKEDYLLSQYYSIRYDIWFNDVVEIYNELNVQMKDLQDKNIVNHEFLTGLRVPDVDELYNDLMSDYNQVLDYQNNKTEYEELKRTEALADARETIAGTASAAETFIQYCLGQYQGATGAANIYSSKFEKEYAEVVEANEARKAAQAAYDAATDATVEEKKELWDMLQEAEAQYDKKKRNATASIRNITRAIKNMETEYAMLSKLLEDAENGKLLLTSTENIAPEILDEVRYQLELTEKAMTQKLGIMFNMSVEKAEVDTFIQAHIGYLIYNAYGELGSEKVGKIQNIVDMLQTEEYGLMYSEIDLLRYLEANRDKTDEEIAEKYDLVEGKTSIKGLVKYIGELFGDRYEFDPVLTADTTLVNGFSAVERNLLAYFRFAMMTRMINLVSIDAVKDGEVIPSIDFNPKKENGKDNTTNIETLKKQFNSEIEAVLTGKSGILSSIESGDNYQLADLFTEDEMQNLINKCVKLTRDAELKKTVSYGTSEYADEDARMACLREDLRVYIEAKYYQAVFKKFYPSAETAQLEIITVKDKTNASLDMLVKTLLADFQSTHENASYVDIYTALTDSPVAQAVLDKMAAMIANNYGDVKDELLKTYQKAIVTVILGSKAPSLSLDVTSSEKSAIMDRVDKIIGKVMALPELNDAIIKDLIVAVEMILADVPFKADADKDAEIGAYVYYGYLGTKANIQTNDYYYDAELGAADKAVRDLAKEMYVELAAKLPANATEYDVFALVLNAIANEEYGLKAKTVEIAQGISHAVDGKNDLDTDILNYFIYILLDQFEGFELSSTEPSLSSGLNNMTAQAKDRVLQNVDKLVDELIKQVKLDTPRGAAPNYSLADIMTAEEIAAFVEEQVDMLIESSFTVTTDKESAALVKLSEEIFDLFAFKYYTAVLDDNLGVVTEPVIHVNEVYGNSLYDEGQRIKQLMRYYLVEFTGAMTNDDIDNLVGSSSSTVVEKEEEEASKYVSDDGHIVAVTYGEAQADGSYKNYKTFILNYNNFAVSVVYEGATYTVPAHGYIPLICQ